MDVITYFYLPSILHTYQHYSIDLKKLMKKRLQKKSLDMWRIEEEKNVGAEKRNKRTKYNLNDVAPISLTKLLRRELTKL